MSIAVSTNQGFEHKNTSLILALSSGAAKIQPTPPYGHPCLDVFLFGGNPRIKTSLLGGDLPANFSREGVDSCYKLSNTQEHYGSE